MSRTRPGSGLVRSCHIFPLRPLTTYLGGLNVAGVGVRLFIVSQCGGYAPMIGGLGYTLAPGNVSCNLTTVAAKDIRFRTPTRDRSGVTIPSVDLAAVKAGGTRGISSPRLLFDMFWVGHCAELAEVMARLLVFTRERYHEFHHREDTDGSESVLAALGQVIGIDIADAQATLW